jgi:polysaccharide biosynthesis/export protein
LIERKSLVWVAAMLCCVPASSQARQQPPVGQTAIATEGAAADRISYRLGPDDQIVIQVANAPDISGKPQRIDPSGDLRLPMVGRVRAAGMTLEQLEAELTTRLKVFLQEPDVAVTVTEFKSQPVSVIGAVATSGVRQLEGRKTLIEMLSLAGGVSAEAGSVVRIARPVAEGPLPVAGAALDASGGFHVAEINLKSLLESRSPDLNIVIRPNDVISVPRAEMVFVVGEVGKPGPVPIGAGASVSVLEAVSSSGGVLRTAKSSHARILRQKPGEQVRTELTVDLQQVMRGKAPDVDMIAGDILVVPDSKGKRAATRALEAAIQAGLMIGSYGLVR